MTNILHGQERFKHTQSEYKKLIDADLDAFTKQIVKDTDKVFGAYSAQFMDTFCDVLTRPANRLRGALAMLAYEMYGGKDDDVAIKIGRIMELVQTYLLVADDVYDRSKIRRGKPAAHLLFTGTHRSEGWKGDSVHFGESIALSEAFIGAHILNVQATLLDIEPLRLLGAIRFLNSYLRITNEGQSNDITNSVLHEVTDEQVDNVLEWKTASYTFDGPLRFGAMLAGASEAEQKKLREFSLIAGRLFQITDDLLGTFGDEFEAGKSPIDDTREGKMTHISLYAISKLYGDEKKFYLSMLGNENITEDEFARVKEILISNGIRDHVHRLAIGLSDRSVSYVKSNWADSYPAQSEFLTGLMQYMLERKH